MAAAEGDDARVLQALFESYAAACRTGAEAIGEADADAAFEEGVERVKEHLLSAAGEAACCMICLEGIRPADPVWSCQAGCYAVMHLPCIQSWARRTLTTAAEKAGQAQPLFPGAPQPKHSACWACPKCRAEYEAVPSGYFCWCGKEEAPPFNPWNAAHSCGERCERRAQGCGHPCVLLCHPGPCPPCPRVVSASCFCGAVVTDKRCGHHEFSCGGICGAELPCGHTCSAVCHDGDCPPCPLVSDVACRCGAEAARLPCSQKGVFQCKRVCGKLLACGRHRCEEVCHAGKCGACKLAGPKACPCGKTQPPEAACDVVVPPCGETCGKLLSCGVHVCHERCHTGPCPQTCRETVVRSCECGKTQRTMQCQEGAFRCERRCTSMRACGRHPCRRRCCDGVSCPPCDEACNKWLKCRNHRCPAPCHSGECAPCPLSARISCACGKTSYSVPCGRETTAKPPRCSHPCPVPRLCRHAAALPPHGCHFGPCPPCLYSCDTALACGHTCGMPACHDPPPPVVPEYAPPPPPVAPVGPAPSGASSKQRAALQQQVPPAQSAAAEAQRLLQSLRRTPGGHLTPCPACTVPVPVRCIGGHTTVSLPCSSAAPFACEQRCGRPLACGNHSCQAGCHNPEVQPCAQCSLPCQVARGTCQHPCLLPCHPPSQACPPCEEPITRPCHCGKTTLSFVCQEVTAEALPAARLCCGKTCHRQLPGCPHTCMRECHEGPCSSDGCSQEVTVRCSCKRRKEKLSCAEVQRLLQAATGSAAYDAGTSLRLLPCDAACAKAAAAGAAAEPAAKGADSSSKAAANAAKAGRAAGPQPGQAAQQQEQQEQQEQQPRRKLSKEEKQRLAEEKQRAKEAAARRQQLLQGLVLAAVLLVAVVLALGVRHLLQLADQTAQAKWGNLQQEL